MKRNRWVIAILLACAVTVVCKSLPAVELERSAGLLLGLYVVSICMLLARGPALIMILGIAIVVGALEWISETKTALTQAPLTALDFRVFLASPRGLWIALEWPPWTMWPAALAFVGLFASLAAAAVRLTPSVGPWRSARNGATITCLALSLGNFMYLADSVGRVLADRAVYIDDLWDPVALAGYSRSVGIVPFLLFSHHIESKNTGPYYSTQLLVSPPSNAEVAEVSRLYVTPSAASPHLPPNIVVLFAESTFNPDTAFRLTRQIESPLFTQQPDTAVLSGLHVNAIGGGSWISEFETIVGVDSRLFGYAGYYTHSTLSPFVRKSLATYLAEKGYDTAAYYPWEGTFYNARQAYGNYGFQRFFDGTELGLLDTGFSDRAIAATTLQKSRSEQREPFFSYVVLAENHGPHHCRNFAGPEDFVTSFLATQDFDMNCELNEYVRRLQSTWDAFETWDEYLLGIEHATGRPYVLLMFGDHQPHTFTSTGHWNFDFTPERTEVSLRETFLHVRTSLRDVVRCCNVEPPPATMIPTLLSAYVASSVDELYLPENFYFYDKCGSEIMGRDVSSGVYDVSTVSPSVDQRSGCREAFAGGLARLRDEGIF